jgi:hypothetical protein
VRPLPASADEGNLNNTKIPSKVGETFIEINPGRQYWVIESKGLLERGDMHDLILDYLSIKYFIHKKKG